MVEYTLDLDSIFGSLADPTRRDILERVSEQELSVSDIAFPYSMSLAAISKHLKILEKAKLVIKRRRGKQLFVAAHPLAFKSAAEYLDHYEKLWRERFDALDDYLQSTKEETI